MTTRVPTSRLLIVGCGFVGMKVAQDALADGQLVYAMTRSGDRFQELSDAGIVPIEANWLKLSSSLTLPAIDHVLVAVPHRGNPPVTNPLPATELEHNQEAEIHAQGLQSLIATLPHGWTKLVYLSTTGVYGHGDQKTVNEETRAAPTRIGPTMALRAEQWLAENLQTDRYNVLRLAGIYGPGRIPLAEKIRAGEPLAVPQHGHLNLIHVADIARVILQLFRVHTRRPMYVLSDGHPVQRGTFYRDLATLCGVSAPQFVDPDPSSNRSLRAGDKCVDPSRLVEELKYQFRYPNYLTGLANALSEL